MKAHVIAKSGRAVEAAGDVDRLLLHKTGTITFGNRMADAFHPACNCDERSLAMAAFLASLSDETPEGKSVVDMAERLLGRMEHRPETGSEAIPFSAGTRLSCVDLSDRKLRKGSVDAIEHFVGHGRYRAAGAGGPDRALGRYAAAGCGK